jgi:putative intracellular protease/amidase
MNRDSRPFQIAILLYPGVTALDAMGPWEVLSRMPKTKVRFVGKEAGPVETVAKLHARTQLIAGESSGLPTNHREPCQ